MTVLKEYQRLEASGLWRAEPDSQRRDVIISVGDATLVISDAKGMALAHWSLPAIERINAGAERPALFRPATDAQELLELEDETMIAALERVHNAIERNRPHPGRLRNIILIGGMTALIGLSVFWLPDAMLRHTVSVVPTAKRSEIGEALLERIRRVAGPRCDTALGTRALEKLRARLLAPGNGAVFVLSDGVSAAEHLPGRIILLNRALVEDYEDPAVAAGFILAEAERAGRVDPLEQLLRQAGLRAAFRLLTTGEVAEDVLDEYAEQLLITPPIALPNEAILTRFASAELRVSPYAYALDISGEDTLELIEADPIGASQERIVLADGDWVALQGICGS